MIWILGGLAFALALLRPVVLRVRPVRPPEGGEWRSGAFQPDAVYPTTARYTLPTGARVAGSWVGSDAWEGEGGTVWLPAPRSEVELFVAGYPQSPGCSLTVEFRGSGGRTQEVACDLTSPGESWMPWRIRVPPWAREMRVAAADRSRAPLGWLGFSEPFAVAPSAVAEPYEFLQDIATFALGLVLLWLPGLKLAARCRDPAARAAAWIGAGPLLCALAGLLAWLLGPWIKPVVVGETAAVLIWAAAGIRLPRLPAIFGVAILVAFAAFAKACYSGGPEGELNRGTVERALAVGNRTDCGASYAVTQLISRRLSPFSRAGADLYAPWSFFSRGPLAGLASAPMVLTAGNPPATALRAGWEPFDPWGYAAYRIVMAILASTVVVALYCALETGFGASEALIGAGAMALCPFVLHETMFTWPKLAATAWLIVSFLLVQRGRPAWAGAALAVGYLYHPLVLLWSPWLGLWSLLGLGWRGAGRFSAPIAAVVIPWVAAGQWCHSLFGWYFAGQTSFLSFFAWAHGHGASPGEWLEARWMNFANTFIPFWLHFVGEGDPDLNSLYGPASRLVKFAFGWWNTLPMGMGLWLWGMSMLGMVRGLRRNVFGSGRPNDPSRTGRCSSRAFIACLIIGPALLLTFYWGDASTGLMREGAHPLVPAFIALAVATRSRWLFWRWFPWLQLPEALLLCWLTTLANPHPPRVPLRGLDLLWLALNVASLVLIAAMGMRARDLASARIQQV